MPVDAKGIIKLRRAIKEIEPELAKETQKEIAGLLRSITNKAKGFVPSEAPLSGWASSTGIWGDSPRRYDAGEIKRGITFSTAPSKPNKRGFRSLATIYNKSAAGAIYETAGRKNPNGQPPAQRVTGWTGGAFGKGTIGKVWETGNEINKSANPQAGKQFIDSMGIMYKSQRKQGQTGRVSRKMNGRLIFRAWGEDNGKVNAKVIKAIEASLDKVLVLTKGTEINMRGR
jgi:hypothetical protein